MSVRNARRFAQGFFPRFARGAARLAGRPASFAAVTALVVAWALAGPYFHFSEGWQLTINTLTTIITFLMVFLIQATQNRDAEAIQLKLDELIVSLDGAHNELIDSEDLDEAEQLKLRRGYVAIARRARNELARAGGDAAPAGIRRNRKARIKPPAAGRRG